MRAPPDVRAFDLGTSSLKAALVSATGHLSALESRPLRALHVPGGGVEQSPDDWWSSLCDAARSVILRAEEAGTLHRRRERLLTVRGHGRHRCAPRTLV